MFDFCFKIDVYSYSVKVLTFTLCCYGNRYFKMDIYFENG